MFVRAGRRECVRSEGPVEQSEILYTLVKSTELVVALRDRPMYKAELADALDVSKSTVYNWTDELAEYGLVERTGEGYRLTRIGEYHATEFLSFTAASRRLYAVEPMLRELPETLAPPPELFEEGSVASAASDPDAPTEAYQSCVASAEWVTGLLPTTASRVLAALASSHQPTDLVVSRRAAEVLRADHDDLCRSFAAGDATTLLVADRPFSFGVTLVHADSTTVLVTACTPNGHLDALVEFESNAAVEWAREVYGHYRADAEPIRPSIPR